MGFSKSGIFDAFTYKNNFLKYILNHRKTKESQRMDYLKLKKIYNKVDTKSLNWVKLMGNELLQQGNEYSKFKDNFY